MTDILDAIRRTNVIESPGLLQQEHQLYLSLVTAQVHDPSEIANIVVKETPAGVPVFNVSLPLLEQNGHNYRLWRTRISSAEGNGRKPPPSPLDEPALLEIVEEPDELAPVVAERVRDRHRDADGGTIAGDRRTGGPPPG